MDGLFTAIKSKDSHEFTLALEEFGEKADISEDDLLQLLDLLPRLVSTYIEPYTFEHEGEMITWYVYESLIWEVGEKIRQILKQHKRLRRSSRLFSEVEQVSRKTTFSKGRESFVMLLGQYGGLERVPVLRELLKDFEVKGHAVYALRLLGAEEAIEDVRPFLKSERTWVRNEAKKYFVKLERRHEK